MKDSAYRIVDQTKDEVFIRDVGPWNEHGTVTNDAERVVRELLPFLKGRRLYYFDSDGDLDELVIRDGKFAGFSYGYRSENWRRADVNQEP